MRRCCVWRLGELLLLLLPSHAWWRPGPGVNWDWRLSGTTPRASAGVEVFDLDLFDVESANMLSLLDSGIVVICYFSAGTYEEYRDDEADFPRSALGNRVEYSYGSWWININDEDIKPVMEGRLDLASEKGCDAVDPDFMEVRKLAHQSHYEDEKLAPQSHDRGDKLTHPEHCRDGNSPTPIIARQRLERSHTNRTTETRNSHPNITTGVTTSHIQSTTEMRTLTHLIEGQQFVWGGLVCISCDRRWSFSALGAQGVVSLSPL
ncbi:unnamed protein product [Ectocarpus sp. 12 AP-2014]